MGYFSIHAATQRVNRLVRQEQMALVRVTADRIQDIFHKCRVDLETLSGLPVIGEYTIARSFRLRAETEFNYDGIVRLFSDFIARTPYYNRIRFLGDNGRELIVVEAGGAVEDRVDCSASAYFSGARTSGAHQITVSDIVTGPVTRFWRPSHRGGNPFAGFAV